MNKYELTVVLSSKLDDEARAAALDKVKAYIERFEGVVGETEEWGKKRLAYEIKKEFEAFYYLINFEGTPATPAGIEENIRIMEPVLRYLVVKKEA